MKTTTEAMIEIAQKLNGKIDFSQIKRSQVLICAIGESVNDMLYIRSAFGVYFYTSKSEIEKSTRLVSHHLPCYVCVEGSNEIFEIK